ncbi:MAG: PLP-dependent cysteine synthase family protein [Rhodocyclaceae bacterium]|nr:PLP-dependent cysteine synthase family protein [Rhodocyclaceae bacterium]MBX3667009.1 PLP-dependent cysteine synthase family protein [Rhodocyclaceae bacterium]
MNPDLRGMASLASAVGHTPLLELSAGLGLAAPARLFAKLESVNPGASIKDRPVLRMLQAGVAAGCLNGGRRLLDSSSGNAGVSYAMFGAALGVPVSIVVPGNASAERLARIAAHGAELILTDPQEGYDYALLTARRLAEEFPERYWYCNQYANAENWRAHYAGTGAEIVQQLAVQGLSADCFVAGVGTGGTLTGAGRRLREANPRLAIVAAIPDAFPGIDGLKPLGASGDIVPDILDAGLIGERVAITAEDALAMCRRLARLGLFVGPSAGAYVHVALQIARRGDVRTIVTVLSDAGERYLSLGIWPLP